MVTPNLRPIPIDTEHIEGLADDQREALGKAVVDNIKGNAGAIATGAATGFGVKKMGGGKKDASGGGSSSPGDSIKKKISLPF